MITAPTNYSTIYDDPSHYAEVKLIVGGARTEYGESSIISLSTSMSLLGGNLSIGNVIVNQFQATLGNEEHLVAMYPAGGPQDSKFWANEDGEWQDWVAEHAQMNPRNAQRVMKAAREIDEKSPLARLCLLMRLPSATQNLHCCLSEGM